MIESLVDGIALSDAGDLSVAVSSKRTTRVAPVARPVMARYVQNAVSIAA
jgi:hypothetical protein